MNRVFVILLFVLLIFLPLSFSVNDDIKIESIEILMKKTKDILHIFNDEPREIMISEDQKVLISKKLEIFQQSNDVMVQEYAIKMIENQKKINKFLAFNKWEVFSKKHNGIKGIYLNGYHFTNEEKMKSFDEILLNTFVNTVVLDVKTDNGHLLYDSKILEVEDLKNERIKYNSANLKEFKEKYDEVYLNCGGGGKDCGIKIKIKFPKYLHYERDVKSLNDKLNQEINLESFVKRITQEEKKDIPPKKVKITYETPSSTFVEDLGEATSFDEFSKLVKNCDLYKYSSQYY